MTNFVYGLKPPAPDRVKTLFQFKNHVYGTRLPTPTLNRDNILFTPDVDENTVAPDCTAVQIANSIKSFSTLFAGITYSVPQQNILSLYAAAVGCQPTLDSILQTDGAVYLDVVEQIRLHGLLVSDQLLAVPNVAVLDNSVTHLALATELYGCANIGIRLYEKDEENLSSETILDTDNTNNDGSLLGRHMTMTWAYTNLSPTGLWKVNFYGQLRNVTTRWLQARVDESYAQIWRNILSPENIETYPHLAFHGPFSFQ